MRAIVYFTNTPHKTYNWEKKTFCCCIFSIDLWIPFYEYYCYYYFYYDHLACSSFYLCITKHRLAWWTENLPQFCTDESRAWLWFPLRIRFKAKELENISHAVFSWFHIVKDIDIYTLALSGEKGPYLRCVINDLESCNAQRVSNNHWVCKFPWKEKRVSNNRIT